MALGRDSVTDLYPEEVAKGITEGTILLVDVREPNETDAERYPRCRCLHADVGVRSAALPDPGGKRVVFACRSGNRSVTASLAAQIAGCPTTRISPAASRAGRKPGLPTET